MTEAVVGVGNPLCRDDGVGMSVVDRLDDDTVDGPIRHAGTNAFMALEAMDGAGTAVLVDAIEVDEPPGTVLSLPFDGEAFAGDVDVTMHDFSVAEALRVGGAAYDLPSAVWLVGVVPGSLSPGTDLSPAVREQVGTAVDRVLGVLAKANADGTPATTRTVKPR